MSTLKPLGNNIVVKHIEKSEDEKTSGGIFIPGSVKDNTTKAEVIAVGPGRFIDSELRDEMPVKAGDTVIYTKFAGTDIKVDDVNYKILSVIDVLAVLEK